MALKDPNFFLSSALNTYKDAVTASILHVIVTDSFDRNGGYPPLYRVHVEPRQLVP